MKTKANKTSKNQKNQKPCLGGFRTVVLTNGKEYVVQFNTTFGIIRLGSKEEACKACRMFLKDAVDVIRDIGRFRVHALYAEVVE